MPIKKQFLFQLQYNTAPSIDKNNETIKYIHVWKGFIISQDTFCP